MLSEKYLKKYSKYVLGKRADVQKKLYMFLEMIFEDKKTLADIARKKKISRQRVSQFLKEHIPDLEIPDRPKPVKMIEISCTCCSKKHEIPKSRDKWLRKEGQKTRFCSMRCVWKYRKLTSRNYGLSKKEIKKLNAIRANKWYHEHKNDPGFKEKIRERNIMARIKRSN